MDAIAEENLRRAQSYLEAIEHGLTGDALADYFTADVVQEEFPNRLVPMGTRRNLAAILESAERGAQVVSEQRYEIVHALGSGDHLALEVDWTATLAIQIASIPAGRQMRAYFAVFLEFRDGKIARQRNYDCFEPW